VYIKKEIVHRKKEDSDRHDRQGAGIAGKTVQARVQGGAISFGQCHKKLTFDDCPYLRCQKKTPREGQKKKEGNRCEERRETQSLCQERPVDPDIPAEYGAYSVHTGIVADAGEENKAEQPAGRVLIITPELPICPVETSDIC
jgi:hypothetical protein